MFFIDSHTVGNYYLAEYEFSNGTLTGTVAQNGKISKLIFSLFMVQSLIGNFV